MKYKPYRILIVLFLVTLSMQSVSHAAEGIRPWSDNPWYWSIDGKPVMLLGGSNDDNLFQWPTEKLLPHLDRMVEVGANVVRNTMSDRKASSGPQAEVYPFYQQPDSRYDLTKWNEQYWNRLEKFLEACAKRKIVVQLEVWDRFDYTDNKDAGFWDASPYNPKNNFNYGYEDSGFAEHYLDHPGKNLQPFFFTAPKQRNNSVVLPIQQCFVNRLLDTTLQYDNVLYCMDNETSGDPLWGQYWAEFIRQRAKQEGKTVQLTEMWDDHDLAADRHRNTFDHPELYTFVDVSQNNHQSGQTHWDNFLAVRQDLSDHPRPMNTTKIYGATDNKFGHSDQDGIERFWRHLLAGGASVRFHRPPSGLGLNEKAIACIRAARLLEEKSPFWTLAPSQNLLSEREPNEAYLASQPGIAYALYFPNGGSVVVDLSALPTTGTIEWIDIDTGKWAEKGNIRGGGKTEVQCPHNKNMVAIITAADSKQ